jgi:diguanylate cyclase (GGDEF)-like protein
MPGLTYAYRMNAEKIFSFFVSPAISKDDAAFSSAKNLLGTCFIAFVTSPFYAWIYYLLHDNEGALVILIGEIVMLSSLIALKYSKTPTIAGNIFVFSLTLLLTWLSYHLGGLQAPTTYWLVLPPLIALFVGNIKSGLVWCFINLILILGIYLLEASHYVFPTPPITDMLLLQMLDTCGLAIVAISLIIFYEKEKQKNIERLTNLAYQDPLTNIPNRLAYEKILENSIYQAKTNAASFAILLIDIDNFRRVNNLFGEAIGNLLLKEIVHRIKNNILRTESMARVGGDQFKLLIEVKSSEDEAIKEIANILLMALKIPYLINKNEIKIAASIGIAVYSPGKTTDFLIDRYADSAVQNAKKLGGDNYQFYTVAIATEEAFHLEIERNLPYAIMENELELYFQPQFFTKQSSQIACVETLLRWNSKTLGEVPPDIFIPMAEKIGMISLLGKWVLKEACKVYVEWMKHEKFNSAITLAINISPTQLYSKDFLDTVKEVLSETGIPPDKLEFELTETAIITDEHNVISILQRLKNLGICTVIDDFGAGYTALSYLSALPVTGIKLDKLLLDNMMKARNSAVVIESIVELAHRINLKVVAEGIENNEQLAYLANINCDLAQGYFLSKPLSIDELQKRFMG